MPPWSQTLRVVWKPELRFFETRTDLLRTFEEETGLPAFRWTDGLIGARLGLSEAIEIQSSGARLVVTTPDGDTSVAEAALGHAFEAIKPENVRILGADFQFLMPLDENYDTARRGSAALLLGGLMPGENVLDWSALLDGLFEEAGMRYQVEFGILNNQEAPARIVRNMTRLDLSEDVLPMPPDFWHFEDLPEVALFMDWMWTPRGTQGTNEGADDVVTRWKSLAAESDRVAMKVHERLQQHAQGKRGAGAS
jgi:hypothetical protein